MRPDPRLESDSIRALYAQTVRSIVPPLVAGLAVMGALWKTSQPWAILTWYALIAASCGARVLLNRAIPREPDLLTNPDVWGRRFAWSTLANGALYGSLAIFFYPADDSARQLFILFSLGIAATASAAVAYYPPAMVAYLVALLIPGIARILLLERPVEAAVAFAVVFLPGTVLAFGFGQARMLRELVAARRKNLDLIAQLHEKGAIAHAAQRRAEQANIAKSNFFAAASHDLRQPLQALGLFAASLCDSERPAADRVKVDQILSSVDALESLFDELLDISRLDAGYIQPAPAHVPAAGLLKRLEDIYGSAALRGGLRLRFGRTRAVLHADPILLERMLSNLLSNALRYTARGWVFVGCRRRGAEMALEVRDTGIGIGEEDRERIFDEFYQVGNPERDRKKGLGLGLATVRRIADLTGCRIELESRVGHGSVFRVCVPAGDPRQVAAAPAREQDGDVNLLSGMVLVVVEDEVAVREGMASLLNQWGCRVVAAASADEAHRALSETSCRPDVIIADYRLRERQFGTDAIAALRARYGEGIPALLVTGDTTPEIFRLARERGLLLLTKPVRAARMRAALLHLLVSSRAVA